MTSFDRVFQLCLAGCNFAALTALAVQWRGEFGARGISPAHVVVAKLRRLMVLSRALHRNDDDHNGDEPPEPGKLRKLLALARASSQGQWGRLLERQPALAAAAEKARNMIWNAGDALSAILGPLYARAVLYAQPRVQSAKDAARRYWAAMRLAPTVFLLTGASDRALVGAFIAGYLGIALLATGAAPVLGALLYAGVHGSFTTVAQPWMGLQFESLIVESNAVFAAGYAFHSSAPWLWILMLRWLSFRLMLAAGAGKLSSGDPTWRDGSAMTYHYQTQPLPNSLSRSFHFLPARWHAFETYATFLFEG